MFLFVLTEYVHPHGPRSDPQLHLGICVTKGTKKPDCTINLDHRVCNSLTGSGAYLLLSNSLLQFPMICVAFNSQRSPQWALGHSLVLWVPLPPSMPSPAEEPGHEDPWRLREEEKVVRGVESKLSTLPRSESHSFCVSLPSAVLLGVSGLQASDSHNAYCLIFHTSYPPYLH